MDSSTHQLQMTQIKHRIDALMDLLYGAGVASHHTIIEQINYLMFLRALTKRDDEAIKIDNSDKLLFIGIFTKYRWDNLLMLNAEDLFEILEEIYRELPKISQDSTIKLLYRDAHVKIYEKPTLRRLVHEIEKLMSELEADAKQGSKDIFGDMYEYLLSKQSQAGTMGQFRTPRHIIKFIVDIVDPSKNETILDPACGTAGFLVAAFKNLQEKYTSEKFKEEDRYPMDLLDPDERNFIYQHAFTGFDSDADMIKFGLMNLYLHQLEHPQIVRQNTLVDTAGNRDKWNIILANPPFSGALDKDSISEDLRMGTRATEILFLRYMIDHLKENGRAGVIVPEGIIFSNSTAHKKIRQLLVDEAGLWCVVSLPAGIFNPYAGVKTSILFFDKSLKERAKDILFVKIENDGFDLGAQKRPIDKNDLPQALEEIKKYRQFLLTGKTQNDLFLNRIKEDEKIGEILRITHDKLSVISKKLISESEDYNLSSERYKIENIISNQRWPYVSLDEILEYEQPTKYIVSSINYSDIYKTPVLTAGKTFILGYTNETNGIYSDRLPVIIFDDFTTESKLVDFTFKVKSSAMKILHIKENRANISFVFYMMQNIKLNHDTHKRYWISEYSKMKIPLPPLEIQQQIVEELDGYQKIISGAKQVVDNWKPRIEINSDWKEVKISEVTEFQNGHAFYVDGYSKDGRLVIDLFNVSEDGNLQFSKNDKFVSEEIYHKYNRYHLFKNNLVIIMTDMSQKMKILGRTAIIDQNDKYILNQRVGRLIVDQNKIDYRYLHIATNTDYFLNQLKSLARGSTQKYVNTGDIKNAKFFLPELEVQKIVVEEVEKERKLVEGNKKLIEIYEQKIKSKIAEVWEK